MRVALIIPDTHRPYHNEKAYDLMLQVASHIDETHEGGLNEIVILGDYADFYCVSSHARDPRVASLLIEEVEDVIQGLTQLDDLFPKAKKVFIEGNHCYRLERYLCDKAPALFGITSTQDVLQLRNRPKWVFVDYTPNQAYQVLGSKLIARHEPLGSSMKAAAAKALCSVVSGHTHKIEEAYTVGLDATGSGENQGHVCFSVGWLGNKYASVDSGRGIFDYTKGHQQWQLGFGVVYADSNGYFYHQKIHILQHARNKYSCLFNGRLFKSWA